MALASRTAFPKAGNMTAAPADTFAFNGSSATFAAHKAANRFTPITVTGVTDPVLYPRETEKSTSNR